MPLIMSQWVGDRSIFPTQFYGSSWMIFGDGDGHGNGIGMKMVKTGSLGQSHSQLNFDRTFETKLAHIVDMILKNWISE